MPKSERHTPLAALLDMFANLTDRVSIAKARVEESLCPNCGKEPSMSESIPLCNTCGRNAGIAGLDMLLAALKNK